MVKNPLIQELNNIFDGKYLDYNASQIVENDIDCNGVPFTMSREIVVESLKMQHVVFRIDPNKVEIFPYFARTKDLKKFCDFIIFAETDVDFLILLIEMKRSSGSPERQLEISESFVDFVIKRAKLIGIDFDTKNVIIRKLGLKNKSISKKEVTKFYQNFHFDTNNYALEMGCNKIFLRQMFDAPVY